MPPVQNNWADLGEMGRWYSRQLETTEPEAACVATLGTSEAGREADAFPPQGAAVILYVNPELEKLRVLVDAARARLAALEAAYTIDKARGTVCRRASSSACGRGVRSATGCGSW